MKRYEIKAQFYKYVNAWEMVEFYLEELEIESQFAFIDNQNLMLFQLLSANQWAESLPLE